MPPTSRTSYPDFSRGIYSETGAGKRRDKQAVKRVVKLVMYFIVLSSPHAVQAACWIVLNIINRYIAMAFCYLHKSELSYMCPGHDIKLHPLRVKFYRLGCVGSDLVLAKALT